MEDEIKVGDYVRDSDGCIFKVNEIVPDDDTDDLWLEEGFLKGTWKSMVKKYSSNIIDLIEVGDYVNGYRIYGINNIKDSTNKAFTVFLKNNNKVLRFWNKDDIKSIVTKEMFKSVEYRMETN